VAFGKNGFLAISYTVVVLVVGSNFNVEIEGIQLLKQYGILI
jgi:hypothetical protein